MFRTELQEKLKAIFGFKKVSFDSPGESYEQDTLFVDIQDCSSNAGHGKVTAKVQGSLTVYSERNKLPFGFFQKKIGQAKLELTENFFFFNFDRDIATSPARIVNISERRTEFVFLFSSQYDPDHGQLTELDVRNPLIFDSGDGSGIDIGDGKILEG